MEPSKVLIYLTGGDHWMGGVQYTRNLIRALNLLSSEEVPRIILQIGGKNKNKGYEEEFLKFPFVSIDAPVDADAIWKFYGKKILKKFKKICGQEGTGQRVLLSDDCPIAFPAKVPGLAGDHEKVQWIPDFQYKRLPDYTPQKDVEFRNDLYARMLSGNDRLLVLSSESVEKDFRHFFPEYADTEVKLLKFHTTLHDEDYNENPKAVCDGYGLPDKFIYAPNQMSAHKGHDTLFQAIGELKREGLECSLVCTGLDYDYRTSDYSRKLKEMIDDYEIGNQIYQLGLVPRLKQIQIFRQAAFVVQASRFEGWSTVVEDSRALGKDIILSNLDVHQEQNPARGTFFDTGNVESLKEKIRQLWPESVAGPKPDQEKEAREQNLERAKVYARSFLEIIQRAYEKKLNREGVLVS